MYKLQSCNLAHAHDSSRLTRSALSLNGQGYCPDDITAVKER
jgi:hypothetical protein